MNWLAELKEDFDDYLTELPDGAAVVTMLVLAVAAIVALTVFMVLLANFPVTGLSLLLGAVGGMVVSVVLRFRKWRREREKKDDYDYNDTMMF